jgi:RimJ/RimL family protein N-acetyltransferase
MKQLLFGHDLAISAWTLANFNVQPRKTEMVVGVLDKGELVGSIMWYNWSVHDIEISYYGPNTVTLGIARECAKIAVDYFRVSRVTARTSILNKAITRGIRKMGFKYEGISHKAYGDKDGVIYGIYGNELAKLAQKELH